jgi:hypothetical protein
MPYVIGIVLSVGIALFARYVGFDRDCAFYPTVMIVIASYYVLFAAMSGSVQTVVIESVVMTLFAAAAVAGSSRARGSSLWRWPAMASLMPFMATLSRTPGCRPGGRPGVSRTTSAPRPVSAGCC